MTTQNFKSEKFKNTYKNLKIENGQSNFLKLKRKIAESKIAMATSKDTF